MYLWLVIGVGKNVTKVFWSVNASCSYGLMIAGLSICGTIAETCLSQGFNTSCSLIQKRYIPLDSLCGFAQEDGMSGSSGNWTRYCWAAVGSIA